MNKKVTIIGGGLAGCEAAYQLLKRGFAVDMFEMRPNTKTPAHATDGLAELVCSNSLKSLDITTASGLLKAELEAMDSLLIRVAKECAVPAGSALAVDRVDFSARVEAELRTFEKFNLIKKEVKELPKTGVNIIATGPLTSDDFTSSLTSSLTSKERAAEGVRPYGLADGKMLHFYDALAPIIDGETVDMDKAFFAARYGKGADTDYLNCGMTKDEYSAFYDALVLAERVTPKDFEVYEGCMPVEVMASRGVDTLQYGPLKPVGLGHGKYHAIVQLRRENIAGTAYNLVGFQTNLKYAEQDRVFKMIPALENVEFFRYGSMHRNTYLNTPELPEMQGLYFAGQITGVEGYCESIMSGLIAGLRVAFGDGYFDPPATTISGALLRYIKTPNHNFQPMGANFGLLPPFEGRVDKKERKKAFADRAICGMIEYVGELGSVGNE